jgi:hypothetical protein
MMIPPVVPVGTVAGGSVVTGRMVGGRVVGLMICVLSQHISSGAPWLRQVDAGAGGHDPIIQAKKMLYVAT